MYDDGVLPEVTAFRLKDIQLFIAHDVLVNLLAK